MNMWCTVLHRSWSSLAQYMDLRRKTNRLHEQIDLIACKLDGFCVHPPGFSFLNYSILEEIVSDSQFKRQQQKV